MKNTLIIILSLCMISCFRAYGEPTDDNSEAFVVDYDLQCVMPEPEQPKLDKIDECTVLDKIDECTVKVLDAMRKLLKTETSIPIEEYVKKYHKQFEARDIARAYCEIVNKRRDEIGEKDPNYVLASLISIGMIESKFTSHTKKKSCSTGLQQVQSIEHWKDKKYPISTSALKYFKTKDKAIRPSKVELINNLELNIDWSLYLLRYFNWNFENYNGNSENKINYDKKARTYVKIIMPMLKGAL